MEGKRASNSDNRKAPHVSICIPAYKRPGSVKRLLDSISIQSFTDYEIIVTDDSPDDSVKEIISLFASLNISYYKNQPALGTPANWNYGMAMAKAEWIKIMHDDDWFVDQNSLQAFVDNATKDRKFVFSRYSNVLSPEKINRPSFPGKWKRRILVNPLTLLSQNVIGPPSVTMIHESIRQQWDERMKWRVDIDYYIRILLKEKSFQLINERLVNVGISYTQVTNDCKDVPEVELPEGLLLLEKYGVSRLKNILVYDAWWRMLRNTRIRNKEQLKKYTQQKNWPAAIYKMIEHESKVPASLLQFGPVSKIAMALSFLINQKNLKD
jgi:glycosyltransferase involved in cell wall biosynthesis